MGAAQRLRHLTITEADRYEAVRAAWPELAERVQGAVEFVDWREAGDGTGLWSLVAPLGTVRASCAAPSRTETAQDGT